MNFLASEIQATLNNEVNSISHPIGMKYEDAVSLSKEIIWNKLEEYTVGEAVKIWLNTLNKLTALNYLSGMRQLELHGFVNSNLSLQAFALIHHDGVVDRIKKESIPDKIWSECTRQSRAACYISFTGFLSRRFNGMIKKALPNREGNAKTFFLVHEKVKSRAMTQAQWLMFLESLSVINYRDFLLAKVVLQGGKRINEVRFLTRDQIDFEVNEITFVQSKTKGLYKETIITYPRTIIEELSSYIGNRQGLVFVTKSGKAVPMNQLAKTFSKAGVKGGLSFKITPHVLRASAVTYLKQQGFADSDIVGVTGHNSSKMIYAYDKSSRGDNASKKVSLVY